MQSQNGILKNLILAVVALMTFTAARAAAFGVDCGEVLVHLQPTRLSDTELHRRIHPELDKYEAIRQIGLKPTKELSKFKAQQDLFVTRRDQQGRATEGVLRVLSYNPHNVIEVIGDFNGWDRAKSVRLTMDPNDGAYFKGTLTGIFNGMQYRLLVNGRETIDPAARVYATNEHLNSVFWDFEGPDHYKQQHAAVDLRRKPVRITEVELKSLVTNWRDAGNPAQKGPRQLNETFNFIADSGVIDELKNSGINAIEFLPFNASADGDHWSWLYQVYGPFAIHSEYGTPAEFARMIDKFNEAGIKVIMDAVIGHFPAVGNEGSARALSWLGFFGKFSREDGRDVYSQIPSQWGTRRYDFENPYVRRYLTDSIIFFIKQYRIGGIRFDNVEAIAHLPGGWQFLHELQNEIMAYAPETYTNFESFGGDNRLLQRLERGGLGATTHNNGDFFRFVWKSAQKKTEELSMGWLANLIRTLWNWNESAVLYYVTNHDEATNYRGDATGSYFASIVGGGGWNFVEGKTRVYGSLAMLAGSFYLDMPQFYLMQQGQFGSNSAVEWDLARFDGQRHMKEFFADLSNYYISNPAFAFHNQHPDIENHFDDNSKVISFERRDVESGKKIFAIINMSHQGFSDYRFGVNAEGDYRVAIDSDAAKYGGTGWLAKGLAQQGGVLHADDLGMHGKPKSFRIPYLAPYSVVILEN